jgi:hypothetical protein
VLARWSQSNMTILGKLGQVDSTQDCRIRKATVAPHRTGWSLPSVPSGQRARSVNHVEKQQSGITAAICDLANDIKQLRGRHAHAGSPGPRIDQPVGAISFDRAHKLVVDSDKG